MYSHPRLTWVHFEAWARGDNVDTQFFTKSWQIERPVKTIYHRPKKEGGSSDATQEKPKKEQSAMGLRTLGHPKGKQSAVRPSNH